MKNLKNNIMSKTQEIIRFIGVCCIALFGLAIILFIEPIKTSLIFKKFSPQIIFSLSIKLPDEI
jgi:hypothetical protein